MVSLFDSSSRPQRSHCFEWEIRVVGPQTLQFPAACLLQSCKDWNMRSLEFYRFYLHGWLHTLASISSSSGSRNLCNVLLDSIIFMILIYKQSARTKRSFSFVLYTRCCTRLSLYKMRLVLSSNVLNQSNLSSNCSRFEQLRLRELKL